MGDINAATSRDNSATFISTVRLSLWKRCQIISLFLDPADEDEFEESEADGDVDAEVDVLTATTRGMLE